MRVECVRIGERRGCESKRRASYSLDDGQVMSVKVGVCVEGVECVCVSS